ncbi:gliding motility protein GldN [Neolewinella aurantiaca]|uniref:Gliding motility protein GldN n=1 Tax=Neolewinella aurantiaca TaxID=2602767 RepID=A0A5C7F355_9BACT|nr:gliding motility protein GldN [Neolewinella aurantiaca]TXF85042.1 gliding motility protein GldN [Neolewinella aurantiaca]
MKTSFFTLLFVSLLCTCASAQTTSGSREANFPTPVNDIVPERTSLDRPALPYQPIREADILWQKRTWRVIDVREKINQPFASQERPLISILMEAAEDQKVRLYSTIDDQFTTPLSEAERLAIAGGIDTIPVYDGEGDVTYELVARDLNPADITHYRIQEMWYIDKNTSTMKVRIIGLAPIISEADENGLLLLTRPLFWVWYEGARNVLASEPAWVADNSIHSRSWDDVFQARLFDSVVTKEENVSDRRLIDIYPDGRSQLIVGDRINRGVMNKEHDLWSW